MVQPTTTGPNTDELDGGYRTIEPWAVGGLLVGLASVVSLWGGLGLLVACGGVLASGVALRKIAQDRSRSGRGAALLGLGLSVLFLAAPAAQFAATYLILSRQARPIADQWFEELRHDHPERAMRLVMVADARPPLDDDVWLYYRHDDESRTLLIRFVRNPLVRTLLALGERATVRYYETRSAVSDGGLGGVHFVYTVTYPDADGKKKTFFASLLLERKPTAKPGLNPWRVKSFFAGFEPPDRPALR